LALGVDRPLERRDSLDLGDIRIPARESENRLMLVNYAGPEGTFARIPFASILENQAGSASFRDKVVFLGVTAQGSGDRLFTPFSSRIGMSGVEIHANVARTILDRAFLIPIGAGTEFAGCAVILALCALAVRTLRGIRLILVLAVAGATLPAICAAALRSGYVLPLGSFGAVFLVSAGIAGVGEYATVTAAFRSSERKRREYAFRVQAIAHEIKTPLTAIQGSSELIAEELVPGPERAEMAGMIYKESKRLADIIHTFLDVERMAAGSLKIEKQSTALTGLCEEVLERARLYASRKAIEIQSEIAPAIVEADPDLLSFAIYNLLTNAVKYSPRNTSIRLDVTENEESVSIAVTDHGYGIAPDEQQRIFERFYRLKRDQKGSEEGTGIGLALVKEIVVQHGGRILVESKPAAGSRFTITLPKGEK
jgi:signal transduction histidine kinase